MINLFDYQEKLKADIYAAWTRVRSVCAVSPTGSGKTITFASLIQDHAGASISVVHRREIVGQISLALGMFEVKHRIVAPEKTIKAIRRKHYKKFGACYVDQQARTGVASAQTLTSKARMKDRLLQQWIAGVTLTVFDEGHHYVEQGVWAKAVAMFDRAKLLFMTACPERADGKGMGLGDGGFCEELVLGPTTKYLIDNKRLAPFVYKAPPTDFKPEDIPITATGDFNSKVMRARVVESHLVGDCVDHYEQHARGLQTIVFATDVKSAGEIAATFQARGHAAVALSGETEEGVRDKALEKFERGETQILVNVDLFDEGFDVPAVGAVIIARPTQSLNKFLQMIGRALRYVEGKTAVILDLVRNWERHGMPDWNRVWTLGARPKKTREEGVGMLPQRLCMACTQPYYKHLDRCPYCGEPVPKPAVRGSIEQVDGVLEELDTAAMAQVFDKVRRANMSTDEFAVGLHAEFVPLIAHPQRIRRHQANLDRRKVLMELIGWWAGTRAKDLSRTEQQRLFYFKYGVDIETAKTLKAAETDTLIERIANDF